MNLEQFNKKKSKLPDAPGVYFFLGKNKKLLYIGKATSLRDRVRSYFAKDLLDTRGPLLVEMLDKATSIDFRQTDSVLEALLLEASLIRTHKPDYNTDLKDDKSFNHVVVTKEDYPRVLVIRGKELVLLRKSKPERVLDFSAEKSLSPRAVALRSPLWTSFPSATNFPTHSHPGTCSGNTPVCLNDVGFTSIFNPPSSTDHSLGILPVHFPSPPSLTYVPWALAHSLSLPLGHRACGSGRAKSTSPQRSSFSSPPESTSSYPACGLVVKVILSIVC